VYSKKYSYPEHPASLTPILIPKLSGLPFKEFLKWLTAASVNEILEGLKLCIIV
jgi:hypothetical protein